jgi:hypothetical protein
MRGKLGLKYLGFGLKNISLLCPGSSRSYSNLGERYEVRVRVANI